MLQRGSDIVVLVSRWRNAHADVFGLFWRICIGTLLKWSTSIGKRHRSTISKELVARTLLGGGHRK